MATFLLFLQTLRQLLSLAGKIFENRRSARELEVQSKAKSLDKLRKAVLARRAARAAGTSGSVSINRYKRD